MRQLTKIKNNASLARDENSGAVLATDNQALKAYKEIRSIKLSRLKKHDDLVERQNKIENDIADIKNMLSELLGKK